MPAHLKSNTSILLVLIMLMGGVLRFAGVNPGFNQYHSDEGISYSAATSMILNGNLDPLRYDYPALVPEINYISFKLFFIPISWTRYYLVHAQKIIDGYERLIPTKEDAQRIFKHDILGDREINALFWGRYTTAFISTLSILLIYLLGVRLVNTKVGLIAAFLLAINFRSVTNSHIGLPDTYNAFFLLISLLLSLRLSIHRRKFDYLLAGIGIGLSLSTKYQTFAVFPFLVMHFCSIKSFYKPGNFLRACLSKKLYIAAFTALFVFLFLNPYVIVHFEQAYTWVTSVSQKYAMGRDIINLFPVHYWLYVDYGFILFGCVLMGLVLFLKKHSLKGIFLLAEVVPFLFVMLFYSIGGFYVRNFITITPIFIVFASYFLYKTWEVLATRKISPIVFGVLLFVVCYISLQNVAVHVGNYMRPWSYKTIVKIAEQVIPDGSIVVGHPFDPLPQNKHIVRIPIATKELYSLSEIEKVNAHFVYINLDWAADPFYGWMTRGFPENMSYVLQKPYVQMKQTFWGLSIEEMMHFVVGSEYKPWQAPEAALFIVKVPRLSGQKYKTLSETRFDKPDLWKKVNESDSSPRFLTFSDYKKAMQIGPGSGMFNISKFESEMLPVSEGYLYKVQGDLSSDIEISSVLRNVFLTTNYFDSKNQHLFTAVSPRFWGKEGDISFISQAPPRATHMTVSIQAADALSNAVYIHRILIQESDIPHEYQGTNNIPESEYQDLLYPNSHGNL